MYEDVTYEEIRDRMLARVPSSLDKREGSVIYDTHSPTAIELKTLYIELDQMIKDGYGDTASRDFLILLCKDRGIEPEPATKAVLKATFTPASVGSAALIGQRFNLDSLNYVVLSAINAAAGTYQVQCETAGITGNQHFGNLIPMEYIQGLETATLDEVLIPGEDEEDTEVLRTRYFNSFGTFAFGGNRADYIDKVKSINGVGAVKVERVWNGDIKPADLVPSEDVDTWYESVISGLSDEVATWLTAVYTAAASRKLTVGGTVLITIIDSDDYGEASPALISSVKNTLDPDAMTGEGYGLSPIGHVVNVRSASPVTISVKLTGLQFNTGYSWSACKDAIEGTVDEYLQSLREDWEDSDYLVVRVSQIESRVLAVEGVLDIESVLLNGSENNITLTKYQIPTFGGVING